jgi:hypothetical protein
MSFMILLVMWRVNLVNVCHGVHPTIAGHTILGKSAALSAMAAGFIK